MGEPPDRAPGSGHSTGGVRSAAFDVVVIGATEDGLDVTEVAAARGARVALVDHDPATSRFELAWASCRRGIARPSDARASCDEPPDAAARGRASDRIRFLAALRAADRERAHRLQMGARSCVVFEGPARFLAADALRVGDGRSLSADAFVIATGSRPRSPALCFDEAGVVRTPPDVLGLGSIPRSLVLIGADWSGCEWASVLARLGCSVQLIDRRKQLLRVLAPEIRELVQLGLHRAGVEIALEEEVRRIVAGDRGSVRVELESGRTEIAECALLLAGERGNTSDLGLATAGIATDSLGHVLVDESGRASASHVYATGSVVDSSGLFARSATRAIRLAGNALGGNDPLDAVVPWHLCTAPPAAACGLSAESARRLDLPVVLGRYDRTDAYGGRDVLQVVLDGVSRRILGAQAVGDMALRAVETLAQAVNGEETLPGLLARPKAGIPPLVKRAIRNACLSAARVFDRAPTQRPLSRRPPRP